MRQAVFIPALLALLMALFLSEGIRGQNPQAPPVKGSIAGSVVRAGTGQPLKGARVSLRRATTQVNPAISRSGLDQQLVNAITSVSGNIATVVTDDRGQFAFTGVDPGQYKIVAERDAYLTWEYGQRSLSGTGISVPLAAGQQLGNIDFQLMQASVISGRVLNPDGEPASQRSVQAFAYQYTDGKRTLAQAAAGQTNDLGEYRLFWLQPGDYFVAVSGDGLRGIPTGSVDVTEGQRGQNPVRNLQLLSAAVGGGRSTPAVEALISDSTASVYYPGTVDPDAATPVHVSPAAETRGVDFNLRPIPTVTVSGRVAAAFPIANTQPGGASVQGVTTRTNAQVQLNRIGGTRTSLLPGLGLGSAPVASDGSFQIRDVSPGSYQLSATVMDPSGRRHTGRTRVDIVNADITNVTVAVRADQELRGKISLESQPPQQFRMTQLRIQLVPEDVLGSFALGFTVALGERGLGANLPIGGPVTSPVAEDGSFMLQNVGTSEYRVQVIGLPQGAYIATGRIGSTDALAAPFTVQDAQSTLEIQLGFTPGRVTGIVVNTAKTPVAGVLSVLVPDQARRGRSELYFSATTDASGQFSFNTVPEGTYKLFAWEDVPPGAYQYPDFIRRYEDQGQIITVSRNGTVNAEVRMIPAGN